MLMTATAAEARSPDSAAWRVLDISTSEQMGLRSISSTSGHWHLNNDLPEGIHFSNEGLIDGAGSAAGV